MLFHIFFLIQCRSPNIEADVTKIYYNETAERYVTQDAFQSKQLFCDFSELCPGNFSKE
jgi:hypothetical protein